MIISIKILAGLSLVLFYYHFMVYQNDLAKIEELLCKSKNMTYDNTWSGNYCLGTDGFSHLITREKTRRTLNPRNK